jgi:hypothetical protein
MCRPKKKAFLKVPKNRDISAVAENLLGRHPGFGAINNTNDFTREIGNGTVCRLGFERTEPSFRHGQYSTFHEAIN